MRKTLPDFKSQNCKIQNSKNIFTPYDIIYIVPPCNVYFTKKSLSIETKDSKMSRARVWNTRKPIRVFIFLSVSYVPMC